jgi:RNA polymerase sigma-70 factor (ECF subfamily)
MDSVPLLEQARLEAWTDEQIVERVLAGETALYEIVMRRYNQRLYRAARAILRDDAEAEDVLQDTYVRAYQHLSQFAGRARFSTWLTRIAVHEALARVEKRQRFEAVADIDLEGNREPMLMSKLPDPESRAMQVELTHLLEESILSLPAVYRTVLMLRDIEEMNTAETAAALEIKEENVKVTLHRARVLLRKELYARAGTTTAAAFPFMATRCDRVVQRVFERLAQ